MIYNGKIKLSYNCEVKENIISSTVLCYSCICNKYLPLQVSGCILKGEGVGDHTQRCLYAREELYG